jgi:alpha-1,3-rhamnosyl/mannosyltransferase
MTMRLGLDGSPLLNLKTGVGRYTHELVNALTQLPFELDLTYYYGTSWSKSLLSVDVAEAQSFHFRTKRELKKCLPSAPKKWIKNQVFKSGFRKHNLDLFHATNYVAPKYKCPMIVTVHDMSHLRYPNAHPADRLAWLSDGFGPTINRAQHVITVSEFTKKELVELFGVKHDKVTVVYEGVSTSFKPTPGEALIRILEKWSLIPDGYLLSVGTLEPRKNLLNLFKAYDRLPDAVKSRWPLVVVGMSGWKEKGIIREMDILIRKGNLVPLGYLSDAELAVLYSGAKLFAYLSLYEGFGLPPLEAMACGAPVISANRTSLPEVIGDAGILVDPEDIEVVTQTLESVLDDSHKCQEMSKKGQRQAAKFTWRICAENTYDVYQKTLR